MSQSPSAKPASQPSPLLSTKPTQPPSPASEPLSPTTSLTVTLLSLTRAIVGTSFLLFPTLSSTLIRFPLPLHTSVLPRLFGGRDLVLAELLYTAPNSIDGGRREIRRALWAGIAADALDVGSVVFAVVTGTMGRVAAVVVGGGAVVFMGMGVLGLGGL